MSRWRFTPPGATTGRWWYKVTVEGGRGARYIVEAMHPDDTRPIPFKVTRSGRTTRTMGRGDLRWLVERVASEAIAQARIYDEEAAHG